MRENSQSTLIFQLLHPQVVKTVQINRPISICGRDKKEGVLNTTQQLGPFT